MTNKFLLSVIVAMLCLLVSYDSLADADPQEAVVYYYGFEIERITGIHEEEIEELGCVYSANSDSIESVLAKADSSDVDFDRRDIRAKIEMRGKSYFVDRAGIARQGDNYFRLDKVQFVASITLFGSCE